MSSASTSATEREAFGLRILKNNHPAIRKIRADGGPPSIHGNKFWKSTYLLMDYLKEYPPKKRVRILEIGCGWGLAGIFCVKEFNAKLTSLDADDTVFPYLLHHADINGVRATTWKCRYENIRKADLQNFDLIIAADVCFWDEMSKPLLNLVRRARQVGGVRVVMSDPGREPFRVMAEECMDAFDADYVNWSVPHPHNASGLILNVAAS